MLMKKSKGGPGTIEIHLSMNPPPPPPHGMQTYPYPYHLEQNPSQYYRYFQKTNIGKVYDADEFHAQSTNRNYPMGPVKSSSS